MQKRLNISLSFTRTAAKKIRAAALVFSFGLSGVACGATQEEKPPKFVNQNLDPCVKLEEREYEDDEKGDVREVNAEFDNVCDESRAVERWAGSRRRDGQPDMASIAIVLAVDVERHPALKNALVRGLARNEMTLKEARARVRRFNIEKGISARDKAEAEKKAEGTCRQVEEAPGKSVWSCQVNEAVIEENKEKKKPAPKSNAPAASAKVP